MKKLLLPTFAFILLGLTTAWPAMVTVFSDDFESGTLANWTTTSSSPLTISTAHNIIPSGGLYSAMVTLVSNRMHRNIIADNGGVELDGHSIFTAWIYDPGAASSATRIFNEVRGYAGGTGLPNGGTTASGSLDQLLAAGKYNAVTLPGEVYNSTKYQGRARFTGDPTIYWFNLNAAGSPNRSTGWHRFDIERLADGTTINFYVDSILSRTATGAAPQAWDTVIMGPGIVSSVVGDAWIDGISVTKEVPDKTTGTLICPTGAPLANCAVLVEFRDGSGVIASASTTTDATGYWEVTLNCANSSGVGTYFRISSPCCGHPWMVASARCFGDLGRLVCQECQRPCLPPPAGMVDWWPFDDPVGGPIAPVANDIAGAVNNKGIHVNNPTPAPGKVRNALCFDGIDDWVEVRDHTEVNFYGTCALANGAENFSIDTWIRTEANTADALMTILDKRVNPQSPVGYSLFLINGRLGFEMADGAAVGDYIEPTASITPGVWHLVAVTVDRCQDGVGLGHLYVDGKVVLDFNPIRGSIANPSNLFIGRRVPVFGPNFLRGCLDELEFFKRALTPAEVNALYLADSAGKCRPCGQIRCPEDIRVWTCDSETKVDYEVDVPNNCPTDATVKCTPPSGSSFPAGTHPVICELTDAAGTILSRCSFTVTVVQDTTPPVIVCPDTIRIESCKETNITYTVTATDDCDTNVTIICNPPSGTSFPPGNYVVICQAMDDCQHVSRCEFKVEVVCQPCVQPPPNMVDWWTFDEPAGPIANDIEGFNNQGLHVNNPTVIAGKVKNALCFNGDGQYVLVRDHPEVNFLGACDAGVVAESFTIDAWIRTDVNTTSGLQTFLDKRVNPSDPIGYSFFVFNGRLAFQMADGSGGGPVCGAGASCDNYIEPGPSITPGIWHLVAVSVQRCSASTGGGIGTLYVDGTPVLTFTPRKGNLNNQSDLYIGMRNPAFGANFFRGCIDELECFKRALTQAEIQSIYNADSAGKCKPCIRCPQDMTVVSCSPNGTDVCYEVLPLCEGVQIHCQPPPCSFFPMGTTTTVTCDAVGPGGIIVDRCTFKVTVVRDSQPPVITCPADITVTNDPGVCGAKVNYPTPQASDNCQPVTVSCSPSSGSFFAGGTTTVTCTATDASGNTANCTFKITVRDTQPPRIVCPNDIVANSDATRCGTTVSYPAPTATDNCPGAITVNCVPPSGSFFPVGPITVNCTATDASGNTAECKFTVAVRDTIPPRIVCPPDMRVWTCSPNGMNVQYPAPTASDNCSGVTVTCTPPSGSFFPPGTNTVTCVATDGSGNTAGCRFLVVVIVDREPPRINCPSNMIVRACGSNAVVRYPVTATDDCDRDPTIICNPPSGSNLPLGVYIVDCKATDDCGHSSECRFEVRVVQVRPPHLTIHRLSDGGIAVCWPTNVAGFVLQCTDNLNPPIVWINVTNVPVVVGSEYCVVFRPNQRHRFYRLCCSDAPWIGHIEPTSGLKEGDVVTIYGAGFGDEPDNLSVAIVNQGPQLAAQGNSEPFLSSLLIPMRAVYARDNMMKARLGPVPPNVTKGPIMIRRGIGTHIQPRFEIPGISTLPPIWLWGDDGSDGTVSQTPVIPDLPEAGPCFFSVAPEGGVITALIRGDWPPDAVVCILAHLHDARTGREYEMNAPAVRLGGSSPADCVARIVDVIKSSFLAEGLTLDIQIDEVPPAGSGVFRITIRIPDGYIDAGFLSICLKPAN